MYLILVLWSVCSATLEQSVPKGSWSLRSVFKVNFSDLDCIWITADYICCNKVQTLYLVVWVDKIDFAFERGLLILCLSSCSWQGCCTGSVNGSRVNEGLLQLDFCACLLIIVFKCILSNLADAQKRKNWLILLQAVLHVSDKGCVKILTLKMAYCKAIWS